MIMALANSGLAITRDSIKTKLLQGVRATSDKFAFVGRKPFLPRQKKGVTEERSTEQPKGPKCKQCSKYGHVARECQALLIVDRAVSGVVMAADKAAMNIVATGSVYLNPKCWPENPIVKYIPSMMHILLCVSQIVRLGHEVKFTNRGVEVIDPKGMVIVTGSQREERIVRVPGA